MPSPTQEYRNRADHPMPRTDLKRMVGSPTRDPGVQAQPHQQPLASLPLHRRRRRSGVRLPLSSRGGRGCADGHPATGTIALSAVEPGPTSPVPRCPTQQAPNNALNGRASGDLDAAMAGHIRPLQRSPHNRGNPGARTAAVTVRSRITSTRPEAGRSDPPPSGSRAAHDGLAGRLTQQQREAARRLRLSTLMC